MLQIALKSMHNVAYCCKIDAEGCISQSRAKEEAGAAGALLERRSVLKLDRSRGRRLARSSNSIDRTGGEEARSVLEFYRSRRRRCAWGPQEAGVVNMNPPYRVGGNYQLWPYMILGFYMILVSIHF